MGGRVCPREGTLGFGPSSGPHEGSIPRFIKNRRYFAILEIVGLGSRNRHSSCGPFPLSFFPEIGKFGEQSGNVCELNRNDTHDPTNLPSTE